MINNYGEYKITCLAKRHFNDTEKEIVMIIESNNESEAKRKAKKQLKSSNYTYVNIISISFLKHTKNSPTRQQEHSWNPPPKSKKLAIIFGAIGLAILVLIVVLVTNGVVG